MNNSHSVQAFNAPTVAPETGIVVPSIDAEIESQVWNAPRPESTNDIILDSTTTEQVFIVVAAIGGMISMYSHSNVIFSFEDYVSNGQFYHSNIKHSSMGTR